MPHTTEVHLGGLAKHGFIYFNYLFGIWRLPMPISEVQDLAPNLQLNSTQFTTDEWRGWSYVTFALLSQKGKKKVNSSEKKEEGHKVEIEDVMLTLNSGRWVSGPS